MFDRELFADVAVAGTAGALLSGLPSTLYAVLTARDPLDGARAAGQIVLPGERRTLPLLAAAAPVHLALSYGWAAVLARTLPRGRERAGATAAGMAIAALDLHVIGRRIPSIHRLEPLPQWADHVAYGAAVGWALSARRARSGPPGPAARP